MKQTYGRRDRREDAIRTWLPAIVLFLGRQSEGSMALMSKCASVLRCSGVVKRTWAIYATYVRCNRLQSTMRFWHCSHRSLREIPCWPHGVSACSADGPVAGMKLRGWSSRNIHLNFGIPTKNSTMAEHDSVLRCPVGAKRTCD